MPDRIGVFILAALVLVAIPRSGCAVHHRAGHRPGTAGWPHLSLERSLRRPVLTLAAALGLSTILESSVLAFSTVKYLGAGYLIYLGVRRLVERHDHLTTRVEAGRGSLRRVFAQGFLIAVLNPKTALFFVAFLPQFVNPGNGSIAFQLVLLGVIFVAIGLCTDTCYALVSGTVGNWLIRRRGFARGHRYLVGGTYLALGVGAAVNHPARAAL